MFMEVNSYELYHYGMPRRSGRYPWGSGNRPYQKLEKKELKDALFGRSRGQTLRNDHTVPSGTIMYRSSGNPNEKQEKNIYVTYLGPDRDLYRGYYIKERDWPDQVYEYQMVSKKDIKVAGENAIREALDTSLKENPKLLYECVESYLDMSGDFYNLDNAKIQTKIETYVEKWGDLSMDDLYGKLVAAIGTTPDLKDSVSNYLKNKGYDAMTDELGVGGKRIGTPIEGIDPLIIFSGDESLRNTVVNEVSKKEEDWALFYYNQWRETAYDYNKEKIW